MAHINHSFTTATSTQATSSYDVTRGSSTCYNNHMSQSSGEWTSGIAFSDAEVTSTGNDYSLRHEQLSSTSVEFIELDLDPVYFMGHDNSMDSTYLRQPLLLPSKPKRLEKRRSNVKAARNQRYAGKSKRNAAHKQTKTSRTNRSAGFV